MTAPRDLIGMLPLASVEVSSHGLRIEQLGENFARGRDVTITFLPGDNFRCNVETASALRRAVYHPVPHIAAREIPSHEALDGFLARLSGEANVERVLLVAGDVAGA